ncbi:hypothetical protein R8Z50_14310 [Longispora sp. K20-0274]|uniref:hypothetical protein n=1 Tax=Longispora sp. K20-0274 TaxID=3088255 RepID=UPI00399BD8E6
MRIARAALPAEHAGPEAVGHGEQPGGGQHRVAARRDVAGLQLAPRAPRPRLARLVGNSTILDAELMSLALELVIDRIPREVPAGR